MTFFHTFIYIDIHIHIMTKHPIISMPAFTPETLFARKAALDLISWFREAGFNPITLNGLSTLRPGFERALSMVRNLEKPPHLFVYFGHGYSDSLIGVKPIGERLRHLRPVVAGEPYDNAGILKDVITYGVACDSLSVLGNIAVERGCPAYFGNDRNLFILEGDLNRDGYSDFSDLFTTIPVILGQGGSTYYAMNMFTAKLNELGAYALNGSYDQGVIMDIKQDFGMHGNDVTYL